VKLKSHAREPEQNTVLRSQVKHEEAGRISDPGRVTLARSLSSLPGGKEAGALRRSSVIRMQRAQGNAYVMRQIEERPVTQVPTTEQAPTPTQTPTTEQAPITQTPTGTQAPTTEQAPLEQTLTETQGGPTPSELSGPGGSVRVSGGGIDISGGLVNVNAAMTRASGVMQADTVIANTVVASVYTPGVGNLQ